MPDAPSSLASMRAAAVRAPLDEAYPAWAMSGFFWIIELMKTIEPRPAGCIALATFWVRSRVPNTVTS